MQNAHLLKPKFLHSSSCPLSRAHATSSQLRQSSACDNRAKFRCKAGPESLSGAISIKWTFAACLSLKNVRSKHSWAQDRPQHQSRHLCKARRKRAAEDDAEEDDDGEADFQSSRGSNVVEDDELAQDDSEEVEGASQAVAEDDDEEEDEEEEEDTADAGVTDRTTRLFQMVKDRDYDDEEEEIVDDEDDGLMPLSEEPDEMKRRGRKRKSVYGRANEDQDLANVGDEPEDEIPETPDEDFLGTDMDGLDDLDAIMGDTFAADSDGLAPEESPELPSRAEQSRPEDSTMDLEDGGPEDDPGADYEDADEEGMGPLPQYNEVPERSYTLGDLMEMCSYTVPEPGVRDVEISGIQDRSEEVQEGDLYVCTAPAEYDHELLMEQAVENGAAAIVSTFDVEGLSQDVPVIKVSNPEDALRRFAVSFYNYPSRKMLMVGVTGSKGKTTTSWLVRGIFEEMQLVTGMVGTLEYSLAVDKLTESGDLWKPEEEDVTLERECSTAFYLTPYRGKYTPPPTTPDTLRSQMVLAGMADRGATACVYESDLSSLQNGWTRGVDLDVAIYMGLSADDVKNSGGSKPLLEGLWPMFSALKDPKRQTAVVNLDDPYCEEIMRFAQAVPSVTFSVSNKTADVYIDKVFYSLWETEVIVATPAGKLNLSSTLIGPINLPNILAAVAAGLALTVDGEGIPLKAIVQGIEATEIVPGRCEVIDEEQDFGLVVDSANDPKSLSRLLDSVRRIEPRRIILITGCEGERNREDRPFIGEIAHYKADTVILTSNNPRGETPGSIIADTIAGYPDELLAYNARQAYTTGFLHDPGRIPLEALEFSWQNSFEFRRYVMEDRWTAIRWAVGTAQKNDCIVIAGKGAEDFQEWDIGFGLVKSWFDDRVECRNALSRVKLLAEHDKEINRKELPWMETDERTDNPRLFGLNTDNLATLDLKYVPKEWLNEQRDEVETGIRQRQ